MRDHSDASSPENPAEALRETLQDYALLTMDPEGAILTWSDGAERTFGYSEGEIVGRPFSILFPPEDRAAGIPAAELSRASRDSVSEDERWHLRKDGRRIWASGTTRALRDERGDLTGYSKLARDITHQKLAELQKEAILQRERKELEDAERNLRHLEEISENIPAFIGLVRLPDQVYVFANRMFREAMGHRQLIGKKVREAHPEIGDELYQIFEAVASSGEEFRATERLIGGQYFDFVLQPMRSRAAGYDGVLIFAVDVTDRVNARSSSETLTAELQAEGERLKAEIAERKRAEALAEQRAELVHEQAAMINLAHDAIMVSRLDGTIELWNCGAEEMYGWKAEETIGKDVHSLLRTESATKLDEIRGILLAQGQWNGELRHTRRNGGVLDVSSRWVLWKRDGQPYGWLEINRDITERKRMEAHLRDTQKMESLGVLAGGIAHDFNNLLTGIMGNISLALDLVEPKSNLSSVLENSFRASEQAAFLTRQILAYAGKGQFIVQEANVSAVVRETLSLVGSSIPNNVRVNLDLSDDLPVVMADVSQLQQVAMNLIFNAAEAIGERPGKIAIRTVARTVHDSGESVTFDIGRPAPGAYAVLEVRDTGSGIDPSVRANIFDPFFTTKFTGRGLGLAAVSGIVRTLNGAIQVESSLGQGTTFRVFLPAGEAASAGTPESREPILVVDDEEIVRRTAEAMLKNRGYEVLVADDGQSAVEIFRRMDGRVSLVLLDMAMPVMSGEETFRELKAIRPDVPVLISSGLSEQEAIRRFGGLGVAGFIQKPYTVKVLIEKISSVRKR